MRRIKLLILFTAISIGSYAQSLIFSTQQYLAPATSDTAALHGGAFSKTDSVYNPSPLSFSANVTFGARVNSHICDPTQFVSTSIPSTDTFFQNQRKSFNFTLHDSLPTGGGGFVIGQNTVVIWPIFNGGIRQPGSDSVVITFNYYIAGIEESPLAHMYIFQNPGSLNIFFGDAENLVQQVRIYDLVGQGIYSGTADRSKNIGTEGWSKGIYLCEINTYSGERRTFKFKLD